jgi:hypothetical protein
LIDPGEDKEAREYASTKSASGTVEEAMAADLIEKDELRASQALIDTKCVLKSLKPPSLKLKAFRSPKSSAYLFIYKSSTCREATVSCHVMSHA